MPEKEQCCHLHTQFKMQKGLCNGTRLIVHNFKQHVIESEKVSGMWDSIGERIFLPRLILYPI